MRDLQEMIRANSCRTREPHESYRDTILQNLRTEHGNCKTVVFNRAPSTSNFQRYKSFPSRQIYWVMVQMLTIKRSKEAKAIWVMWNDCPS